MTRSSCLAAFVSALTLGVALPGAAMAHFYPPHSDCAVLKGTDHLACNKAMANIQRTGAHPAPGVPGASTSAASTPGSRAGTKGANTGVSTASQHG